jgi:hypothetical protein
MVWPAPLLKALLSHSRQGDEADYSFEIPRTNPTPHPALRDGCEVRKKSGSGGFEQVGVNLDRGRLADEVEAQQNGRLTGTMLNPAFDAA